jgi:hypothetical protein
MKSIDGIRIVECDTEKFYKIVNNLYNMEAIDLTEDQINGEDVIFAVGGIISFFGIENPVIYSNKEIMETLKDEWIEAILTHECAHCKGIKDEEDADLWALKHCSKEAQDVLIYLWDERHGHKFEER